MSMRERDSSGPAGVIWLLLDASGMGGIEKHVCVLCRALIDSGRRAEIVLLTDHGRTPFRDRLDTEGLPYRVLRGGACALVRALRQARPALVHTHGYKAGVVGRIAARMCGFACVSTFHAGERAAFPVNLYQRLDEALAVLSSPISVSAQIAARLPWASALIPNFVSLPPDGCDAPLPRRIVFVGRLSAEKGPDIFCEIARRNASLAEFHIYGDGPMRASLEAEYGGEAHFHGHVANVDKIWRDAGLLLIASRAEGLPMACLEALSHGVPVAAARVGALPDVLGESGPGWLFPGGDVEAAGAALAQWAALAPGEHQALRDACRARIADRFGIARGLEATLRVYGEALSGRELVAVARPGPA